MCVLFEKIIYIIYFGFLAAFSLCRNVVSSFRIGLPVCTYTIASIYNYIKRNQTIMV